MRQDIIKKETIDRRNGGSITHKMERGTAGELLFLCSGGSFNRKDIITVKLRHAGGVDMVIDRMPAILLSELCDMRNGRPNFGGAYGVGNPGQEATKNAVVNTGEFYAINAIRVPIGHISLADAKSELEITVDMAKAFGNLVNVKIANIEPASGPDFLLQYDKSNDLEATHYLVRELYLWTKSGESFFTLEGESNTVVRGKDVNLMIYTDGGAGAYETDIEVMGANTSIDSSMDHSVTSVVCAYSDRENLPTPSLRIKVTGEDVSDVSILCVKEKLIQTLTSVSTIAQIDRALVKTEAIERMGGGLAKAYRHAGAAKPSGELAELKQEVLSKTPEAV